MKIGLLPLYIELYDRLLPERIPATRAFVDTIAESLRQRGLEVVPAPVCRLHDEFASAISQLESAGCEALATLHLAYSPSLESADLLAASPLPVVVIDTTPTYEFHAPDGIMLNHGIHGVQDLCNLLLRHRKPFALACGHWQESDCLDTAVKMLKAAGMAWRMAHLRVGKVGGDFQGMGDFRYQPDSIGLTVVEWQDTGFVPAESDIAAEMASDRAQFALAENLSAESHRRTAIASLKLREWVTRENLQAFTVAFPGITRQEGWETVPFLECSKAMARGIGYAGEGDTLTAATTRCLLDAFPESSFMEMFCPDWKNNRIFTSHMGEINVALCADKPLLNEKPYVFSETGNPLVATGCFRPGEAILTDLAPGPEGRFTLITAPVTWLPDDGPSRAFNAGWFRPAHGTIAEFLAEYSRHGGTHHLTTSYHGDLTVLREWARLMRWDYVELK
ncbi:MAG: hypothetical protein IJJ33_04710 [Victivallales bacterium]|nr:hypothetical protein [Victivallales bacterium]